MTENIWSGVAGWNCHLQDHRRQLESLTDDFLKAPRILDENQITLPQSTMANIPGAAPRLLSSTSRLTQTSYICATCRSRPIARYTRQFSASTARLASNVTATSIEKQPKDVLDISQPRIVAMQARRRTFKDDPSEDPNYVPAKTWDGLDRVGSKAWIYKAQDRRDTFQGWSRAGRAEITAANINQIMGQIKHIVFGNGSVPDTQAFTDGDKKIELLQTIAQITGLRLPDHKMSNANTLADIRHMLLAKPKSRTFAEANKAQFEATPNVQIRDKRQTRIDKDEAKGKWKLIVKGLQERGLPVYGKDLTTKRKLL
ncbi:hypothetical protein ANO11243_095420 [Dothideomycetidae sp. 11243]|nr:hypothetical protein ANO11243_095420 [fungal sp. No.11243]